MWGVSGIDFSCAKSPAAISFRPSRCAPGRTNYEGLSAMHWTGIKQGQEWRAKKTGRHCIVEKVPEAEAGYVHVLHLSGRCTAIRPATLLRQYDLRQAQQDAQARA